MIVEIVLNFERVGQGVRTYVMDTDKLTDYKPVGSNMPSNIKSMVENVYNTDIMHGDEPDWFGEELENMIKEGVVYNPKVDKSFEIAYC
jgi:hypothetical protein